MQMHGGRPGWAWQQGKQVVWKCCVLGYADSGPGGIRVDPMCPAGLTSRCTASTSLCWSLCFGDEVWKHHPWLCVGIANIEQYLSILVSCYAKAAVLSAEMSWRRAVCSHSSVTHAANLTR